jgi:protease I
MPDSLSGKKIAIIATDGVEQVELVKPREAVQNAGASTELLSLESGEIQAMNSDLKPADTFAVDKEIADASPEDYDGLILPGGTVNADRLRMDENVISFLQRFFADAKPVGVICHGPWSLVEADLVRGRTLTSYPSLRTDIRNAGGEVVDEEVVVDQGLVSSRNPDDLPAFCAKIVEEFAEGRHETAREGAVADQGTEAGSRVCAPASRSLIGGRSWTAIAATAASSHGRT